MTWTDELKKFTSLEEKEKFVYDLTDKEITKNNFKELLSILTKIQGIWEDLSTARLTKIFLKILDGIDVNKDTFQGLIFVYNGLIEWCVNKTLLRCELKRRLVHIYLVSGMYKECLDLIKEVVVIFKKFDDKLNLIRIFLYESKVYYMLRNSEMARSALTAARAMSVSVACPAVLQAQIDILNGMFLVDDGCFDSATGYFVESIEGYIMDKENEEGKKPLRYLILNKILNGRFEEINGIFNAKFIKKMGVTKETDDFISLLIKIGICAKNRDVIEYQKVLTSSADLLETDLFISKHLSYFFNRLFEKNIVKIIEPYSHVKIQFIAEKLCFDGGLIEDKLRVMILDKKINGILDHKTQCLVLFEKKEISKGEFEKNVSVLAEYMEKFKTLAG
ncbi:rpn6 [Ecytonucleospora hepatopenaei]|uniref:Rpn6 n=1 Tax=Ecytonucleospora hepatopenaei TaxID=646526 RepID=A0A1W0E4P2_9MICR|nr:rpn6 [Ecytonucleospora hepatopenaei]